MNFQLLIQEMLKGTQFTVLIFLLTLLFSLPLGLIVSFGRMSKYKIIRYPVQLYLLIMRGTPLMLQLMFVFSVCRSLVLCLTALRRVSSRFH